jgi:hypothetical protein
MVDRQKRRQWGALGHGCIHRIQRGALLVYPWRLHHQRDHEPGCGKQRSDRWTVSLGIATADAKEEEEEEEEEEEGREEWYEHEMVQVLPLRQQIPLCTPHEEVLLLSGDVHRRQGRRSLAAAARCKSS